LIARSRQKFTHSLDLSSRITLTTLPMRTNEQRAKGEVLSANLVTKLAVFLITLSGLILEVGLTRIYSASIWYHFAFVAISVALLGWGLGGFTVHLWKQARGKKEQGQRGKGETGNGLSMNAAAVVTLLYAAAIPLCLWLLVRYPFDMDRLPLYFLAPLLPFFLAGMALSIVFDIHRAVAGSLYFWDLIGASIGAVAVTLLLHLLGGEAALLAASAAPAVAALLMSLSPASRAEENKKEVRAVNPSPNPLPEGEDTGGRGARVPSASSGQDARAPGNNPPAEAGGSDKIGQDARAPGMLPRVVQVAAALGVVLAIVGVVSAVKYGAFRVKPGTTKAMRNQMDATPGSHIVQTGWNAYSRIDCVEGLPNSFARLYIDSDAWTGIRGWDGNLANVQDMKWSYRALPFRLTPNAETLIIGPGGGPDVVAALASGSKKVTAVEMNPLMLKFVRSYGARAGNLYDRPDVETVLSEGRNFVSRTDKKFDIILLGFVDSWASVASGGLSLSENYLYTAEAMRAYYDHLKPDGILVVLRWEMDIPRLTSNAVATLGAGEAAKRVVVLMEKQANPNDYQQMLFMLRKEPFTDSQLKEISTEWTQANDVIMPGGTAPPGIKEVLAGTKTLAQYDAEQSRFVGPVWDDSPFYFAIEKPWRMPGAIAERMVKWLLGPSMGMLALFAVFGRPRRKRVSKDADGASAIPAKTHAVPAYVGSLVYFAALGFGFIAVELALLQHLTLLVGHPIYTLSVLLFTLLAFGGIGASLSSRWSMWKACAAVALIGTIEALALPKLVPALLWLPLWGRIVVAIVLIAPLGLAMGMPFPRGLKQTGEGSLPAPPFYWGLNGIMSVIGSVTTVFVALIWGFQAAMLMGSACYVLAALASLKAFPSQLAVSGEQ
jgi:SAM-dependent methyltransferase